MPCTLLGPEETDKISAPFSPSVKVALQCTVTEQWTLSIMSKDVKLPLTLFAVIMSLHQHP